jgi:hypothetical protein
MKIAVGLWGIHYVERMYHWKHFFQKIDYKNTYNNQKEYLYTAFENSQCDFYSSTYFSPVIDQLIKDYNFSGLRLSPIDNSYAIEGPKHYRRNRSLRQTVRLILDQPHKNPKTYDYVLFTRYDLFYKQKLNTFNLDFNKINLLGKSNWHPDIYTCDDNFYFMPFSKLEEFNKIINSFQIHVSAHNWLSGFQDAHFVIDGYYTGPIPADYIGVKRYQVEQIPVPRS